MGSGWGFRSLTWSGQIRTPQRESRSSLFSSLSEYISGLLVTIPKESRPLPIFEQAGESRVKSRLSIRQLFEIQIQQTLIQSGKAVVMFLNAEP